MKIFTFIFTSGFLIYQVLGVSPYSDNRNHHDDEAVEGLSPHVRPNLGDITEEILSLGVQPYITDRVDEKVSHRVRPYLDDSADEQFTRALRHYLNSRGSEKISDGVRPYFENKVDEKELYGRRQERGLKDQMLNFLEYGLRYIMRNGNDTLGIPVLDVYRKDEQIIELDMREIMLDGSLYDFTVAGLSNYVVIDGDVKLFPPKVIVTMNFPEIRAKGFYALKGEALGTIPLFGAGKFDVVINDFFYDAIVGVGLGGDLIKSLGLKIALGKLELDATGLFNDENISRLLSRVISDMAPNFIRDFHDKIVDFVEPQIVKILNGQLDGLSWKDLMEILG